MILVNIKRVFLLKILVIGLQAQFMRYSELPVIDESGCKKITNEPFFTEEVVLDKTWKAYYVWEIPQPDAERCFEVTFKRANRMIVHNVRSTMRPYLADEPDWSKASFYMKLAPMFSRSLLIADPSGIPGYYQEIMYLSRHGPQRPEYLHLKSWKIYHVAMKMVGRYLILYHCMSNVMFLMLPQEDNVKVDRQEIKEVAESLHFGRGWQSCIRR